MNFLQIKIKAKVIDTRNLLVIFMAATKGRIYRKQINDERFRFTQYSFWQQLFIIL